MRAEYKRDMNHNYLVLHEDVELDTSSYQVRMLVGNVIPSLLKCQFHGVDGNIVFHYDITSKQSVSVIYEQKLLHENDLRLLFGSFVKVMEQMSEYLLNPGQVLLQPDYMYMDVEKKEIFFCYLPGTGKEIKEQFQFLMEYILPRIDHEDEGAVVLGYGIYRRSMEDNFRLEYVKEELYRQREYAVKITKKQTAAEPDIERRSGREIQNPEFTEHSPEEMKESMESLEALFGYGGEERERKNKKGKQEKNREDDSKKKKKETGISRFCQRLYIVVPIVGTIIIMAILAANMMGILPWLRVEWLLMMVFLASVIISLGCYLQGLFQKRKQKKAGKKEWEKKAERMQREEQYQIREEEKQSLKEPLQEAPLFIPKQNTEEISRRQMYADPKQETYGETVVLSAVSKRGPASLISKEPGELAAIYLEEDLTVIGKLKPAADAVIALPTISRLHAKIRRRDGEYYLADLNSRNGTSVNGQMLKVNEEYLLQDEDEVSFAEARYIFIK